MAVKPLNSVGGFSVGSTPVTIIYPNGSILVNNFSTTGKSNLNSIGNIYISGGSNGQVIQTDGLGNLSFTTINTSSISNGNSNIRVLANANITFSSTGNANIVVITGTGVNVTGYLNVNGNAQFNNANLGNLATANFANFANDVVVQGNIANANNVSITNNLEGNTANFSGNITSLNANLGNLVIANFANFANDVVVQGNIANANNISITNNLEGNTANFSGNIASLNANLGNLVIANFANFANDVVVQGNIANANNVSITNNLEGNTANFSGNIASLNANLGNLVTANFANFANDVVVQGNIANANNVSVTYEITSNTANITGNLTTGNANLGNLVTANFANFANDVVVQGNIANANNISITNNLEGNTANFSGNIASLNANLGNLITANYANLTNDLVVQGNIANANNISITNNLEGNTANFSGNITSLNANLGNLVTANFANFANDVVVQGNIANANNVSITNNLEGNTANFSGNITSLNANLGNLITANYANLTNDLVVQGNIANANNVSITNNLEGNTANFSGNITSLNANLGNLVTANFANFANDVVVQGNIANANNVSITNNLEGNTANFSGNITSLNANLGNLVTANFANFTNDVVVQGNIANANNVSITNNLEGNTANFSGNVVAANFVGPLSNGISNVKVYNNANIEFTINGTANVATISSTGLFVAGEINTTTGNMLSNGNITANLFLNSANANVTGEALLGSVKTANIIAPVGTITISAAGANQNINLAPTGVGNVDVGLHHITQVSMPINPGDAATKEYVDNVGQGLVIHPPANVTAISNLTASYFNGGTVLSVTDITGNKTITFSINHGLVVNDDIEFTNSFNGIIAGEGYYVFSTPTLDSITIRDGYFGSEVTTLVDGTGLTQPALGNAGVGATLTNAGAQIALTIDAILMTVGARILVQGQTNQFENGIYTVTIVGTGATNWVITRSSDGDSYAPQSIIHLASRSYFFISQGSQFAGSSYVLTSPTGEIHFGVTNIVFTQFSLAISYTSGPGIYVNGTVISANVDNDTTAIAGGNIVVKAGANLTTPNLGDATFSSLSWNNLSNGNVTANNLSIGNIANITGNLRVDGVIQSNGNISSNAYINGNNAYFTNFANIGGNLLANNITSNHSFSTNTANITSNLITSNATINLELSGNTANFSGNITSLNANLGNLVTANFANFANDVVVQGNIANANNISITNNLEGNTANFSGNIASLNANLGNLVTANFANFANDVVVQGNIANANNVSITNNLEGNTANFSGNIASLNANLGNLVIANFANFANDVVVQGNIANANNISITNNLEGNTANFSGNITSLNANLGNLVTANFANFANDVVVQGNIANANNVSITNNLEGNTANFSGNIASLNANLGNLVIANFANFANDVVVQGNIANANNVSITHNLEGNTANFSGNITSLNANLGNLVIANFGNFANDLVVQGNIANANNVSITYNLEGNTANFSGNIASLNANLGNLVIANFANFTNDVVVQGNIANANNVSITNNLEGNTANFSGNITSLNANLGNLVIANFGNFANDLVVQGNIANANNIIVTYEITSNTANITGNLTTGNANLGNLATANNFSTNGTGGNVTLSDGNVTGANVVIANSFTSNGGLVDFATNNANVQLGNIGNVYIYGGTAGQVILTDGFGNLSFGAGGGGGGASLANGNSNIQILANANIVFSSAGNANIVVITDTGANVNGYLTVTGNVELGSVSNVNITGGSNGQVIQTDGLGNLSFVDGGGGASLSNGNSNIQILANANIVFSSAGNANIFVISDTGVNVTGTINVTGDAEFYNANLGNLAIANYANFTYDVVVQGDIANANNIIVTYEVTSNTANVIGNLTTGNANLGNLVTANFANFANDVVVQGNIANANNVSVTYNVRADSANVTRELDVGGNIVTGTGAGGNITGVNYLVANFINSGSFANGTSNIRIAQNGNVTISSNNTSNVLTISNLGSNVIGYMQANGIISAGGFVGSNLVANVGILSLSAKQGGTAYNINLLAGGAGNIDVGDTYITSVKSPINSQDVATKEYVDNISQGLLIHPPADVLTTNNLTASYLNGGTPLTVDSITENKTITFTTNHGLIAFDAVIFTNTFNGIIGGAAYFVYSAPTLNSITVKNGYDGVEVTTLTNFPTLAQPALGNGGVGATLTNSGTNIALTIDSVLMTVGARVLVIGQTNQFENGIYDVTTVGVADIPGPGVPWVLTRSSDGDSYQPASATALCVGSYFFITQGTDYAGSSFTLTEPTGDIQIGISNIVFTQFSAAGAYTPGQGINISGTVISANVDNETTAIVGGDIVVKTSANLITPNIGEATGTTLTLSGNLISANATLGNLATANYVTVANTITTSNITISEYLSVQGNIVSSLIPYVSTVIPPAAPTYISPYSLGATAFRWNKAHLGNAGVYIGDYTISVIETVEFMSPVYRLTLSGGPLHAANFFATNSVTANVSISATGGNIFANALLASTPPYAYISGGYVFANNITVTNTITAAAINATTLFTGLPATQVMYANATGSLVGNVYFTFTTPNEVLSIGSAGTQLGGNVGNGFINVANANVGNIKVARLSNSRVVFANSANTLVDRATFTFDYVTDILDIGATRIAGNILGVGGAYIQTETANVGNVKISSLSSTQVVYANSTKTLVGNATFTYNDTTEVLTIGSSVTKIGGNVGNGFIDVKTANVGNTVKIGVLTQITYGNVTTTSVTANQTIASLLVAGITGAEFLVKAIDSGGKYSVATVSAVTNGTTVDYSVYGTVQLGGYTGNLAVNVVGSDIRLQVTPASSNSTIWVTQARII